jgi:hypothetical protein
LPEFSRECSIPGWSIPGPVLSQFRGHSAEGQFRAATAIYFSFGTLATLGYGDVVPVSDVARGVDMFEAIAGQLYLAVMVARLVSLYVVTERSYRSATED